MEKVKIYTKESKHLKKGELVVEKNIAEVLVNKGVASYDKPKKKKKVDE